MRIEINSPNVKAIEITLDELGQIESYFSSFQKFATILDLIITTMR